ncbi:MAG: hypothetical protein IPK79_12515 [Vampirovibrionales bacterium]|nr:hypothetical protein [Vampirovibrionales bacterium]
MTQPIQLWNPPMSWNPAPMAWPPQAGWGVNPAFPFMAPPPPINSLGPGFGWEAFPQGRDPFNEMLEGFLVAECLLRMKKESSEEKPPESKTATPSTPASSTPASSSPPEKAAYDPNLYGRGSIAYDRVHGQRPLLGQSSGQGAVFGPSPDQDADYAARQNMLSEDFLKDQYSSGAFATSPQTLAISGEGERRAVRLSTQADTVTINGSRNATGVDLGAGNNQATVDGIRNNTQILAQDGDNTLTAKGQGNATAIHLGGGHNRVNLVGDFAEDFVTTKGGQTDATIDGVNGIKELRLEGVRHNVEMASTTKNSEFLLQGFSGDTTFRAAGDRNTINVSTHKGADDLSLGGSNNKITAHGGEGNDTYRVAAGDHNEVIIGDGAGANKLVLEGAESDWVRTSEPKSKGRSGSRDNVTYENKKTGTKVFVTSYSNLEVSYA